MPVLISIVLYYMAKHRNMEIASVHSDRLKEMQLT